MSSFPDLYIVIVHYKLKLDTTECIESFLKAGAVIDQIVVVDNGSQDDSAAFLREKFGPGLSIVTAEKAFGYANGLNLGLTEALSRNCGWFLLMNNDTLVEPDFLTEMEKATHLSPDCSLFSPLILYHSDPRTIWFFGSDIVIPGLMITRNTYQNLPVRNFPDIQQMDLINGCAMLVKREVIEKLGFFDTSFYMYAEDSEFCWRAYRAGYKMAGVSRAKMVHKVSKIMNTDRPQSRYLRIRNQIWVYRQYAGRFGAPVMFLFSLFRSLVMLVKDVLRGHFNLIMPLVKGWYDGWTVKQERSLKVRS